MRYYVRAEMERFLRAVDRALLRRATIVVIGGGAAALHYRIDDPTTDIDTFNALGSHLRRAIDAARKATGRTRATVGLWWARTSASAKTSSIGR